MNKKKLAHIAGWLYLVVIVCGVYAEFAVRDALISPGDAESTARAIRDNALTFRVGIFTDVIAQMAYFILAFLLYRIFHSVNSAWATFMILLVTMSTAVTVLNLLNQQSALEILNSQVLQDFSPRQMDELALFFSERQGYGYSLAGIFYGGWLLPLGWLIIQSGYIPKVFGYFLFVSFAGYMIDFTLQFLTPEIQPQLAQYILIPAALTETIFCLWLVFKGVKVPEWD